MVLKIEASDKKGRVFFNLKVPIDKEGLELVQMFLDKLKEKGAV